MLNNVIESVITYKEINEPILTYENYISSIKNTSNNVESTPKAVQKKTLYFFDKISKMGMKLF